MVRSSTQFHRSSYTVGATSCEPWVLLNAKPTSTRPSSSLRSSSSSSRSAAATPSSQTPSQIPFLQTNAPTKTRGRCQTLAQNKPLALPPAPPFRQNLMASRVTQTLQTVLIAKKLLSTTPAHHNPAQTGNNTSEYRKATRPLRAGFVQQSILCPAFL